MQLPQCHSYGEDLILFATCPAMGGLIGDITEFLEGRLGLSIVLSPQLISLGVSNESIPSQAQAFVL